MESRELLLQISYSETAVSYLISEKPDLDSQMKQLPLEFSTLSIVDLFHVVQLRMKVR